MRSDPSKLNPVKVLEKAFAILEELQKDDRQRGRLNQIAVSLRLPKATAFRILKTLELLGYVDYNETGETYCLSDRARNLGYPNISSVLMRLARPVMTRLVAEFEQTVNLAVVEMDRLVYKAAQEGLHSVRMQPIPGVLLPWEKTALGKSILAYLPKAQVAAMVNSTSASRHSGGVFDKSLRGLEQIRLDGFALDIEESERGLCCVGAPIFDRSNKPFASISISGSSGVLTPGVLPRVGRRLVEECRALSAALGCSDTPYLSSVPQPSFQPEGKVQLRSAR
jgi:IclR family acetate operon transcriptional repressor